LYAEEKEETRQEVNKWIRSSDEFDGVIDFDEAGCDPIHPTQILSAYERENHLHVLRLSSDPNLFWKPGRGQNSSKTWLN
jgi:hypothetical protein